MIKFNKFNVTSGQIKARVSYSLDNRFDGQRSHSPRRLTAP